MQMSAGEAGTEQWKYGPEARIMCHELQAPVP